MCPLSLLLLPPRRPRLPLGSNRRGHAPLSREGPLDPQRGGVTPPTPCRRRWPLPAGQSIIYKQTCGDGLPKTTGGTGAGAGHLQASFPKSEGVLGRAARSADPLPQGPGKQTCSGSVRRRCTWLGGPGWSASTAPALCPRSQAPPQLWLRNTRARTIGNRAMALCPQVEI